MAHGVTGSIFEAFVHAIRDQYATDTTAPAIATNAWMAGRLKGLNQAAAPSIRYRRLSGSIQPAERRGPFSYTLTNGDRIYFTTRFDDLATVEARITATGWAELDCVWSRVLAATWDVMGAQSVSGTYDHVTEGDDDQPPEAQKGNQIMVQRFEWRLPIPHDIGTEAEINTIVGTSRFINVNPDPGTAGPTTTQT